MTVNIDLVDTAVSMIALKFDDDIKRKISDELLRKIKKVKAVQEKEKMLDVFNEIILEKNRLALMRNIKCILLSSNQSTRDIFTDVVFSFYRVQ